MKLHRLITTGVLILSLAAGKRARADRKGQEAGRGPQSRRSTRSRSSTRPSPKLKGEVAKAPGYAVFTTYGLSFLVGGAGGKGVAHDNKTKKDTFMDMAQASAGSRPASQRTRR